MYRRTEKYKNVHQRNKNCEKNLWKIDYNCCPPGFLVSLMNRNWSEARQEIQARPYWAMQQSRGEQITCLLTPRRAEQYFLTGSKVGMSRGWLGGGLSGLPIAVVVLSAGVCTVPCLAPNTLLVLPDSRRGSWHLIVHNFAPTALAAVIFSPLLYFICILLLEEVYILLQVQALQPVGPSPGPSLSSNEVQRRWQLQIHMGDNDSFKSQKYWRHPKKMMPLMGEIWWKGNVAIVWWQMMLFPLISFQEILKKWGLRWF